MSSTISIVENLCFTEQINMKIIESFLQETKEKMIVYLDLDGVITDFEKAFENLGQGTMEEVINRGGDSLFYALISGAGLEFWSQMEWTPDGRILWNFLKPHHPIILSAPFNNFDSINGKKIWVKRNLGNVPLILKRAKEKKELATPNSILIDDRPSNIKDWNENGGIGILHKNTKDTIKKLKKLL